MGDGDVTGEEESSTDRHMVAASVVLPKSVDGGDDVRGDVETKDASAR